jgi:hypothetical protein
VLDHCPHAIPAQLERSNESLRFGVGHHRYGEIGVAGHSRLRTRADSQAAHDRPASPERVEVGGDAPERDLE